jgi:glucosylceramidase
LIWCAVFGLHAIAPAALLDDFRSYGTGKVKDVAMPPWIAVNDTSFAEVRTGSEGPYITWGWESNPRGAALVFANVHADPIAKASTAATVYFRISAVSESVNHSFGVSDRTAGFSSFDDYKAQVIVSDNGLSDGRVNIVVRDGGAFAVIGTIDVGRWYNVWLVINNSANRFDVYLSGDDPATAEITRAAHNAAFRSGTTGSLNSIFLWCQNQGQNVRLGKIALRDGVDLSVPRERQLLVNGHFEDGDPGGIGSGVPGWRHWGSSGSHHDNPAACLGRQGMKLWSSNTGLWQNFEAVGGNVYDIRARVMDWSGETSANNWNFRIDAEFYSARDIQLAAVIVDTFNSSAEADDTWVQIGGPVTAPAGTAYGRVVIRLTGGTGTAGSIYFDHVSVISSRAADPDYTNDSQVNLADLSLLSGLWQKSVSRYDLNGDAALNFDDLLIFAAGWLNRQIPFGAETITVHPATRYQEIEGFGASLTDSSAWLIYRFLNASERRALLTDLFDPDQGIGLNYLRQPMGASDFRLKDYSYNDLPAGVATDYNLDYFSIAYDEAYIIPTLQEILDVNPDVRIMASPWSPPVWMKTTGDISYGSLKSDVYDTYANYFVKFIQAYAAHGIAINAITPQNEPGHEGGGYAGCKMSASEQIKLVKKLGAAFQTHNLTTDIIIWDFNWSTWFPLEVLSDPAAKPFIAGTAFHHYAGDISAQAVVQAAHPDKGIYFTEGSDSVKRDNGWTADMIRNGLFVIDALRHWSRTVIKWNLALDEHNGPKIAGGCNTCYGVVTINQATRQITPRPQYYPLGHAAKFLRPGAVRIASGEGNIRTVAFQNTDGSLVLYAVNPNTFEQPVQLEWDGQRAISCVPGHSIMTFRWDNVPGATADVYLTAGDQTSLLEKRLPITFYE